MNPEIRRKLKKAAYFLLTLIPTVIIAFVPCVLYLDIIFLPVFICVLGFVWYFALCKRYDKISYKARVVTAICLWVIAGLAAVSPYILFALASRNHHM